MARKKAAPALKVPAPKPGVMAPKPAPPPAKTRAKRIGDAIYDIQQATDGVEDLDKRHMIDESLDEIRSATDGWAEDVEKAEEDLKEAEGKVEDAESARDKATEALKVVHDWIEARLQERLFRCAGCDRDVMAKCATCRSYEELLSEIVEVL